LSNFASGILILLYRPYDVGDVINAGGVTGKVDAMSLVSTTVITPDNQKIVAPNNSIWGDTITNITGLPTRRVDMTFGVGYGDDLDKVMETLAQVCSEHEQVLDDPAPVIKVTGHGDSAVDVICRPWVKTEDYWGVYWDFHKTVKQKFDAAGINIPFPQRDVHMITA
ncbi:MAG: mechanosensitive ion channel family protein, partial [Planctomycetota bacterium]